MIPFSQVDCYRDKGNILGCLAGITVKLMHVN